MCLVLFRKRELISSLDGIRIPTQGSRKGGTTKHHKTPQSKLSFSWGNISRNQLMLKSCVWTVLVLTLQVLDCLPGSQSFGQLPVLIHAQSPAPIPTRQTDGLTAVARLEAGHYGNLVTFRIMHDPLTCAHHHLVFKYIWPFVFKKCSSVFEKVQGWTRLPERATLRAQSGWDSHSIFEMVRFFPKMMAAAQVKCTATALSSLDLSFISPI